jgi:hypothetical protein
MFWDVFPSGSENQLCDKASKVLRKHPDTIRNAVRMKCDVGASVLWQLTKLWIAKNGIDAFMSLGEGE